MSIHRSLAAALVAAALLFGAACGDDDSPSTSPAADRQDADGQAPGADADDLLGAVAGDDADQVRDIVREHVGLEGVADALKTALKADRVEVDGDTVHVYLSDRSTARGMVACVASQGALGNFDYEPEIVVHEKGEDDLVC